MRWASASPSRRCLGQTLKHRKTKICPPALYPRHDRLRRRKWEVIQIAQYLHGA
jgi:ribosomal protein L37E